MDCFTLLKKDHDEVDELLKKCKKEGTKDSAKETFKKLARELSVHIRLEETMLYPRFREQSETKSLVDEAYKEHGGAERVMAEMAGMSPDDEQWQAKLKELKQCIEHHVKEEEKEFFPKASKMLGKDGAKELGQEMADEKQEMMRGSHGTKEVFERLGL